MRHGGHCVFELHVHLVFVTKYRKKVCDAEMLELLKQMFSSVCQDIQSTLEEMNGETDHVHLLVAYPPQVSISKLVNSLKGVSSRLLRKECPGSKRCYWTSVLWSPSYFAASCGGAPLALLERYIQNQKAPQPSPA
jgi:putative transposase